MSTQTGRRAALGAKTQPAEASNLAVLKSYVIKGRICVSDPDREEVVGAGDLLYWRSGHTGRVEEDIESVELSPRMRTTRS